MLKYYDCAVTFAEFPDEISLCVNITNCPCYCNHCSEPWLRDDTGTELTEDEIDRLISMNPGITLFGLMGGDRDHDDVVRISKYIHSKYPKLKVGMYSGMDSIDMKLLENLDYYKFGRWIKPTGNVDDWWKTSCGPIKFTFSNQVMLKRDGDVWLNITNRFREKPINNLKKEIIE